MRLAVGDRSVHLTYCGNVHPTPDCAALAENLRRFAAPLAARFGATAATPMAAGLFFGEDSGAALEGDPERLRALAGTLEDARLHALTANAFPLGAFHGARVKESVYLPDWNDPRRAAATLRVARLMAALPCASEHQSVSTLPGAWKGFGRFLPDDAAGRLAGVATGLAEIEAETGRRIVLAVEPEPGCVFETTEEWIRFFEDHLLRATGDEATLRRHVGTCWDCCHQAVELEDPVAALDALDAAGIAIAKMQLSSALRVPRPGEGRAAERLARFDETRYLHQVITTRAGARAFFPDLPDWLAAGAPADELRCHFHLPIFASRFWEIETTQPDLERALDHAVRRGLCTHFEVETYTFDVLPQDDAEASESSEGRLLASLERELAWARDRILAAGAP